MNELIWVGQVTGVIMFLAHLAGGVAAIHSIMSNRTAQGAIAWSLSLAFLPLLAVPLYLVTGRNRFAGYVFLRREGDEEIRKNYPNIREAIANVAATPPDDRFLAAAIPLAGLPMTRGNSTELLPTTEEAFEKMFESIERAENYLLVFFFIVRDDSLGDRFQKALASKAREGVRVLFGYDEIGSRKLKQPYLQELRTAGVEVFPFRTSSGIRRLQINFRNHRKILIADGEEAFLGGLNVSQEYVGEDPKMGRWRDTHFRIRGPAVACVQVAFLEDWRWMTGKIPTEFEWNPAKQSDDVPILIAPTGPSDRLDSAQLIYVAAVESARERAWIATPFFVPDQGMVTALQAAALRGVDVRIILPGRPHQLLVDLSSKTFYREMLSAGVKVYRYNSGFLHQKVFLVDDDLACVGTANLDNRSFRLNFEIFGIVPDRAFAAEVEAMLEADLRQSTLVQISDYSSQPWWYRLACRLARLMAPIQ